ncbi:Vesicle-fusing ATPase [Porphyridium purpureum]|uniref:Vesicle-fusing ATPase n=1 Tax=Porphyridium purpureum TaxID=35688 RepID=A0A5J4YSE8_PORPP|nr:Vesicle-fusing ATPase [Porphyridium purpureum]|eukprot:POR6071..scf236_6
MFGMGGSRAGATVGGKSVSLNVVSSPSQELARQNRAFLHAADFDALFGKRAAGAARVAHACIGDFVYVVQALDAAALASGAIAFNSIQRRELKVALNDRVDVSAFGWHERAVKAFGINFEVELVSKSRDAVDVEHAEIEQLLIKSGVGAVFTVCQKWIIDLYGTALTLRVTSILQVGGDGGAGSTVDRAEFSATTQAYFSKSPGSSLKIKGESSMGAQQARQIFKPDFDFEKLGIGGLDKEFGQIFRRAFASRVFPPSIIAKLGINHVKGMLLFGPPGTGKTLIARQIGKMLNAREPKVVNGPEILDKFVGGSEKNIRELFAEAESDFAANGEQADLHIIVFDEIDAICKKRGSARDSTGVHDTVVNQILSKIDGVNALNNILVIGMTNRKDMIDDALLRPGRLEVHVEISLPDEHGRLQILSIHTSKMRANKMLGTSVSLEELAGRTKNYSGAEIEGLCKSAAAFALNRHVDYKNLQQTTAALSSQKDQSVVVEAHDFDSALEEVQPAFGMGSERLERCLLGGFINFGERLRHVVESGRMFIEEVRHSRRNPLLSVLIEGSFGTGKTALAAKLALESEFPFVRLISPEQFVGYGENSKCAALAQAFDDAHKSPLSVVVLDNIERMIEYAPIGPRFSNAVLQTLMVLVKSLPPEGRRLLILGTTSSAAILHSLQLTQCFNAVLECSTLNEAELLSILQGDTFVETFSGTNTSPSGSVSVRSEKYVPAVLKNQGELSSIVKTLNEYHMGIKKLLMVLELAKDDNGHLSEVRLQEALLSIR